MRKAEILILVAVLAVGGLAFGIEALGPDAARIIAIAFCSFLIVLMVLGMVTRARAKQRQLREMLEEAARAQEIGSPSDERPS